MTEPKASMGPTLTMPGAQRPFHVDYGYCSLCPAYLSFFHRVREPMAAVVPRLRKGRAPSEPMAAYSRDDVGRGPHEPCICGSGKKGKKCHGSVRDDELRADR